MDITQRAQVLVDSAGEIARSLVADMWQQLPGYDALRMDPEDLTQTVTPNVAALLQCVAGGRAPDTAELEAAGQLGNRRAVQGVPIEAVVTSWHRAERTVLTRLTAAGTPPPADQYAQAAQTLAAAVDLLTTASTEAYRRTRTEAAGHLEQIATDLVSRLAGSEALDPADLEKRARLVGVAVQAPHRAIALGHPDDDPLLQAQVLRPLLDAVSPRLESRVLVGSHSGRALVILPEVPGLLEMLGRAVKRELSNQPVVLSVGLPRQRFAETSGSCREALAALEVGLLTGRRATVVEFSSVASDVLLVENPLDVRQVISDSLGPLLGSPRLAATLRSFLTHGLSVRATAADLSIHENTVSYRLRRICEVLGVERPSELVRSDVLMALRALELTAAPDGGPGEEWNAHHV